MRNENASLVISNHIGSSADHCKLPNMSTVSTLFEHRTEPLNPNKRLLQVRWQPSISDSANPTFLFLRRKPSDNDVIPPPSEVASIPTRVESTISDRGLPRGIKKEVLS